MSQIELDVEMLKDLIEYWGEEYKKCDRAMDQQGRLIASCYKDAYQTILMNHDLPCYIPKN